MQNPNELITITLTRGEFQTVEYLAALGMDALDDSEPGAPWSEENDALSLLQGALAKYAQLPEVAP